MYSNCCAEPVSYAAVEEDGTSGLVIEVFDDLDKVGTDVLFMVAHEAACQTVKSLLEVYETLSKAFLKSYCPTDTWTINDSDSDLSNNIKSRVCLFADNTILHSTLRT